MGYNFILRSFPNYNKIVDELKTQKIRKNKLEAVTYFGLSNIAVHKIRCFSGIFRETIFSLRI